jgi:PST family polysaccharide transporter
VAFPIYSRIQSDLQQAAQAFQTQILGISVLLFPVYGLLLALAPTLTEEVLGPQWIGTAPVIRILAVASLLGLLGDVAVPIFKGLGQPAKVTLLETVQTSLLIGFVWELARRFGLPGAAAAWLPAILASQILSVVFLRRIFHRPFAGLLRPVLLIAAIAAIGAWVALFIDRLLPGLVGLFGAAAAACCVLGVLLLLADHYFKLELRSSLALVFPKAAALLGHPAGETEAA